MKTSRPIAIFYDRDKSWSKGEFWTLYDVDDLRGDFVFEYYLYPSSKELPTQHFTANKEEIKKWIQSRNSEMYPHLCTIQSVKKIWPMRNIWQKLNS